MAHGCARAMSNPGSRAELALCSSGGRFLGVAHTWCSCEVELSFERRNEQVFSMFQCGASESGPDGDLLCSLKACNGTFLCAGSPLLEHERVIGTSLKPFRWMMVSSRGGLVALYSVAHRAFLGHDLSLHEVPVVQTDDTNKKAEMSDTIEELPVCLWLCIPIPLKCEEGRSDGYYSVTKLLYWGHDSAVLRTEVSSLREPSVIKSIPCARAAAIRRIDSLLYQSSMPGAADAADFLCPLLSKMTQTSPSCFYAQKLCFRSLETIFTDDAVVYNDRGDKRLSLSSSLAITRRCIDIVQAVHALGFVLLDANPRSFCEGQCGDIASLQLVDMKNVMKLEPKTYSTPASFVTKSGGRFSLSA